MGVSAFTANRWDVAVAVDKTTRSGAIVFRWWWRQSAVNSSPRQGIRVIPRYASAGSRRTSGFLRVLERIPCGSNREDAYLKQWATVRKQ